MAVATRIPATAIAAQTHPDSPDEEATGATAADVLVAGGAEGTGLFDETTADWSADEPADSEAVGSAPDAPAPLTAPSASWNLICPSTG